MTRSRQVPTATGSASRPGEAGRWQLQDAKARFSEVVRRACAVGPQHVSVRGRDEVVVVSADEYRRMSGGDRPGSALVEALMSSPHKEVEIEPERFSMSIVVRDVEL